MNCQAIRNQITSRTDPTAELPEVCATHLGECDLCRHWYADFRLDTALAAFPVPEPDEAFADRVIGEAKIANRTGRAAAPRLAIAASIAVLSLVVGLLLGQQNTTQTFEVALAPYEDRTVDVVIDAAQRRTGAVLTVAFAPSLEIPGHPGRRSLTWTTDLEEGKNLLQLPIRLMDAENSYFTVSMAHEGTERVLRVDVRAQEPTGSAVSA